MKQSNDLDELTNVKRPGTYCMLKATQTARSLRH